MKIMYCFKAQKNVFFPFLFAFAFHFQRFKMEEKIETKPKNSAEKVISVSLKNNAIYFDEKYANQ